MKSPLHTPFSKGGGKIARIKEVVEDAYSTEAGIKEY